MRIEKTHRITSLNIPYRVVLPFLFLAVLALLTGLWAGLFRLGWDVSAGLESIPMSHGPLMISGFLGTLIALERVVALRQKWMFASPLLSGLGWVASIFMPHTTIGPWLIVTGSLVLVMIFGLIVKREKHIYTLVIGSGALCWLVGNLFWLSGRPIYEFVLWWAAFLIFTIAGERIELSRVLRTTPRQYRFFLMAALVFLAGTVTATWLLDLGMRVAGAGMLLLAAWLLRYDIARRNLRHPAALTRFIALCLFLGYAWLGTAGLIALTAGGQMAGMLYDALLHTIFVGFVISMIFGHAPIIIPAITGALVPFSRVFYAHLMLLHVSLVLRTVGDLTGWIEGRKWGGLFNEVAILLFIGVTAYTVIRARRKTV